MITASSEAGWTCRWLLCSRLLDVVLSLRHGTCAHTVCDFARCGQHDAHHFTGRYVASMVEQSQRMR